MPPSLVVVAWSAFGSVKVARDFLADGTRGVRGIKPGLPVVVVGGADDGEVKQSTRNSPRLWHSSLFFMYVSLPHHLRISLDLVG